MATKKVAIVQSNYIPWKGYFDMIAAVDEFILLDDVQYTRRDWRNRNRIKTPQGLQWLTIPVKVKGKYKQSIRDTEIDGTDWIDTHLNAFTQHYRQSPYFEEILSWLEKIYLETSWSHLSTLNRRLIEAICEYLDINTVITDSCNYTLVDGKTQRLVNLCQQAGAQEYISGPAAKCYTDVRLFEDSGIQLTWFDYAGYCEYPQLWGNFRHEVTILDMLFNCGKNTPRYMKHVSL